MAVRVQSVIISASLQSLNSWAYVSRMLEAPSMLMLMLSLNRSLTWATALLSHHI